MLSNLLLQPVALATPPVRPPPPAQPTLTRSCRLMHLGGRTGAALTWSWLRRVFASKAGQQQQQQLPPPVLQLLKEAPVECRQAAGAGRGLFASRDLSYGEVLWREAPYLCVPSFSARQQVCYGCLRVLPPQQRSRSGGRQHVFCDPACRANADSSFYTLEAQLDLTHLDAYCQANRERFPLLAARLALMVAQQAMLGAAQQGDAAAQQAGSSTSSSSLGTPSGSQADPSTALSFLCHANVPPPPPAPWQEAHSLLLAPLQACSCREDAAEARALAAAVQGLDIDWYVAVLSRLHLNTFKVQNVLLSLDWDEGLNAAAAALQEDSTGSALYLLASLLNHSCEPSVNVVWPANNGTAAFTAARDISAGEQLYVSYIDCEQEVSTRQEFLAWSYGFRCKCAKCVEELADAAKREPPRL